MDNGKLKVENAQLPKGWEMKKLGEVCDKIFAGGDKPKNNFSKFKTEEFNIPIFANGEKNKGLYGFTNIEKVTVQSITISARGTIGYSVIRKEPFYPIVRLIVLIPNNDLINLDFLWHITNSMDFSNTGSSIPQLTVPMVKKYEIPLPPLPEQTRIVSILDKAFAEIAKAKANAEQNLKNAKELFESYLQRVFFNGKLKVENGKWVEKTLGEVCEIKNGGTPKTKDKEYWNGNINWITPKDLGKLSQRYVSNTPRKITSLGLQKSSAKLLPINSIILSTRAPIGHLAINKTEMATNQGCRGIIPIPIINFEFIYYFLKKSVKKLNELGTGATFKELSTRALSNIEIPFPSLKEQQSIVKKLDTLQSETKKLENIYQQKILDLEELKKSILQKAFNGELKIEN